MKIPTHANRVPIIPLILPLFVLGAQPARASILLTEDFETDGMGIRYTATGAFSDGGADYFTRTDLDNAPSGMPAYTGFGGSWFWAAEDVDATENPTGLAQLDFSSIDVSAASAIRISIDIGAGSISAFDSADDHVHVQYRIDGGEWATALAFENDGNTFNGALRHDADLDGIGEGRILGLELLGFSSPDVAVSGSLMDLRIDTLMTSGGEAVAFDTIQVVAVPEPAMTALLILLFSLLIPLRRPFLRIGRNENRA
jgi:hypothetical protein